MLWYKGWLETRIKLGASLGIVFCCLAFVRTHQAAPSPKTLDAILSMPRSFGVVFVAWLAGAGITTQPAFQAMKGIHGSTLFTLSLPVSRLRLLAVRAALGWLETAGVIVTFCCGIWLAYPPLRAMATPVEMLGYAEAILAFASVLYFLSVLLATFLEDTWRIFGTIFAFVGWWWVSANVSLPAFADIFGATGHLSPLIAHTMPWTTMAFSVGVMAVLFAAALTVVQAREY